MAKTNWQKLIDQRARSGLTIGQNWYDSAGLAGRVSAKEAAQYAISKGYGLGEAWKQYQPAKNSGGVKSQLRQAAEGGITKQELSSIVKNTGQSVQKVIQKLDTVNKALKEKDKAGINLNSGAANMLIKQAQKQTQDPFGRQETFGSGQIGKALQGMIGTPSTPGAMIKGQRVGGTVGTPGTGLMIGGTTIRPGGRVAVRQAPAPAAAPAAPAGGGETVAAGGETTAAGGDQFDFSSFLNDLFGPTEEPAMPDMPSMESFDALSSDFTTPNALMFASLGQSYLADAIRAAQRQQQTRGDFMRQLLGSVNPYSQLLSIGGGVNVG